MIYLFRRGDQHKDVGSEEFGQICFIGPEALRDQRSVQRACADHDSQHERQRQSQTQRRYFMEVSS